MKRPKCIGMIPARIGSTRLKRKNLALVNGVPMVGRVARAALESECFDRVIVNGDSSLFQKVAQEVGCEYFSRNERLGGDFITSDEVVSDFLQAHDCDYLFWVNSTSPLVRPEEIKSVVTNFIETGADSLITVERKFVHAMCGDEALNFSRGETFARTQDLKPVDCFVYSIMGWNTNTFKQSFASTGFGIMCGEFLTLPISKLSALIVKSPEDLLIVDAVAKQFDDLGVASDPLSNVRYWDHP